jgi:hypothetical protein
MDKSLFNTEDGKLFHGSKSDLAKARKGTPEYNEWLEKYRAKKGVSTSISPESASSTKQTKKEQQKQDSLKARKALAGVSTLTTASVKEAFKDFPKEGSRQLKINGVNVVVLSDEDSVVVQVPSLVNSSTKQAAYIARSADKLTNLDFGMIAKGVNKIINSYKDDYLPKRAAQESD